MNWVVYTVGAAVALAVADVFVKMAAGKLPDSLGMLLYGTVPFSCGLIWFILDRSRQPTIPAESRAVFCALVVGVMFALVTFALYAAFRNGAPISVASPVIRIGGLLLASAVGLLIWKEPVSVRYLLGLALACSGVYLIVTR